MSEEEPLPQLSRQVHGMVPAERSEHPLAVAAGLLFS